MTGFTGQSSHNQERCENCGVVGAGHDKERVYDDKGPAGSYHFKYRCPDDSGRYRQ